MSFQENIAKWGSKLKLDSHHEIERFGVIVSLFALSFVFLFGGTVSSKIRNDADVLSDRALYTDTVRTSRTDLQGHINGVYVSKDHKRSMVLMKFSDIEKISLDANNYRGFMTAFSPTLTPEDVKNEVDASIYVFGQSGYMGVMLESPEPFAQQILGLTMRGGKDITFSEKLARVPEEARSDDSFRLYDQWRIYFNPGANEAIESESLSVDKPTVGDMFNEMVIVDQEAEVREKMDTKLAEMQVDLNRIDEYETRLANLRVDHLYVELPEVPAPIAGDEVTGDRLVKDENGQVTQESTLVLNTDHVIAGGYDFAWRPGSVRDGYFKHLVREGSYVSYLRAQAEATKEAEPMNTSRIDWMLSDGTNLIKDHTTTETALKPFFDTVNSLSTAYKTYYDAKRDYQVKLYTELLELEVSLQGVRDNSSINTNEQAVMTY